MSRTIDRKTRRSTPGLACMQALAPVVDEATGRLKIECIEWTVRASDLDYQHLYDKAHRLMPVPTASYLTTPNDPALIAEAIRLLENPDASENAVLRAIGILGHSPCRQSLDGLSRFADRAHPLSPVARLAFGECAALFERRCQMIAVA